MAARLNSGSDARSVDAVAKSNRQEYTENEGYSCAHDRET